MISGRKALHLAFNSNERRRGNDRRLPLVALVLLCLLLPAGAWARARPDLLFLHARLLDGTGNPWRYADVAVTGDRITFVGDAARAGLHAARTIDLHGRLYLCPGFIDLHTHTAHGLSRADMKQNLNYLTQGVTTVVNGNDGMSLWPIGATLARWRRQGVGTNVAMYVGEGTIRKAVLGMADRAPTPAELQRMQAMVARAMHEGAIGLSTGLFYVPQSFSKTDEIIALARVAAQNGGIYDTHLRDEGDYTVGLKAAVAEAIEIGRQDHMTIVISHIKALGHDVWGQSNDIVKMIDQARAEGIDVVANQYPYSASLTSFEDAVVPNWAMAGGRAQLVARIHNPATRQRLLNEIPKMIEKRGGPSTLVMIGYQHDPSLEGKSLADMAAMWRVSAPEAVLRIVEGGPTAVISHNMSPADIDEFMKQDWVATGSDGESALPGQLTHPRSFGTFTHKLQKYVREEHIVTLPFAIRAATSLPATIAGFKHRGQVRAGNYADLVVFDYSTVGSPATYAHPSRYSTGIRDVLVNGRFAIENGQPTHALAGRVLTGPAASRGK